MRTRGSTLVALGALMGLVALYATDQIVPAASPYQAQLRIWLAARASGLTALLLLWAQVLLGLIMSHPTNQTVWKLSKRLFPWHEDLVVFSLAFLALHVASIVADPYAGVGLPGALIPGLSSYRSVPVALGSLGLYALIVTALTARFSKRLPPGAWLRLHRFSLLVFALAWFHGMLSGTDSGPLTPLYVLLGSIVVFAAAHRYWVTRRAPPGREARGLRQPLAQPTGGRKP